MAIMVAIVVLRLAWLQIFTAADLAKGAENNRTNDIVLHARRGTIYDRNGNVLAMSVDCKDIYANPSEIKDASTVAQIIASFLGGSPSDYLGDLQQDTTFVYVRRRVDLLRLKKHLTRKTSRASILLITPSAFIPMATLVFRFWAL